MVSVLYYKWFCEKNEKNICFFEIVFLNLYYYFIKQIFKQKNNLKMKQRIRTRDYKMGDATLIQLADDFKSSATRDLTELTSYGLSVAKLTTFQTLRDTFSDMPTDVELMGALMFCTQQKNDARNFVLEDIRQVTGRARMVYKETDGRYRSFGVEDLSNQTDNELVRTAKRVVRMGERFLTELADKGLTQAILDNLSALALDFDNKIDLQGDAIKARDIAVDERIAMGNELYARLVELGEMGKLFWASKNEAKYNDYIIYKSVGGKAPQHVAEGVVAAGSLVSASVSGISTDTELTLINDGGVDLQFYFAPSPVDETGAHIVVVPPNGELSVQALSLGFNEVDGSIYLNVRNTNLEAAGYRILWG